MSDARVGRPPASDLGRALQAAGRTHDDVARIIARVGGHPMTRATVTRAINGADTPMGAAVRAFVRLLLADRRPDRAAIIDPPR